MKTREELSDAMWVNLEILLDEINDRDLFDIFGCDYDPEDNIEGHPKGCKCLYNTMREVAKEYFANYYRRP